MYINGGDILRVAGNILGVKKRIVPRGEPPWEERWKKESEILYRHWKQIC